MKKYDIIIMVIVMDKERNYGIDALRIVSMFFVIILHCIGRGGILASSVVNSPQYKFAWILEIIAYCAVDIFALISGYVSYKKTKLKSYINLWFMVVYYCLLIVLFYQITNPSIITSKDYIVSFFPVTNNSYWYFTAYTGLFVLKPLLDKAINNMDEVTLKKLFYVIIGIFSIYGTITKGFGLGKGYSVIWLIILYLLGAIMSKCEIGKKIKGYQVIIGLFILVLITYVTRIYWTGEIVFLKSNFNILVNAKTLVDYTSPSILGIAILLLIGFSKIKFNKGLQKVIAFGASSAFAVYLINTHYLVWNNYMLNLFKDLGNSSILVIAYTVIGFAILFVVGSILIDKVRIYLFKILKVNVIGEKLDNKLMKR